MILGKEERLAFILLILVFLAILTAHIILSKTDRTLFAEIYENNSDEGEFVTFTGSILNSYTTKTGGHLVIETDGPAIFFENGKAFENLFKSGDKIKATGIVSFYSGNREIVVEDIKDIEFL